jgi:hypothetical protein
VAAGRELKLTLLMTWQDPSSGEFDLLCHGEALPQRPRPPVKLQIRRGLWHGALETCVASASSRLVHSVPPRIARQHAAHAPETGTPASPAPPSTAARRGLPRTNARAKDSEWVRQRRTLEEARPADCNEVVLCSPDGAHGRGRNCTQQFGGRALFGVVC